MTRLYNSLGLECLSREQSDLDKGVSQIIYCRRFSDSRLKNAITSHAALAPLFNDFLLTVIKRCINISLFIERYNTENGD